MACSRRQDACGADDGCAIESDKGRLRAHDAKQPPEHRFQAASLPLGLCSEQRCWYRIAAKAASENGDGRRKLVWPKVAYLDDGSFRARHRMTIPSLNI